MREVTGAAISNIVVLLLSGCGGGGGGGMVCVGELHFPLCDPYNICNIQQRQQIMNGCSSRGSCRVPP